MMAESCRNGTISDMTLNALAGNASCLRDAHHVEYERRYLSKPSDIHNIVHDAMQGRGEESRADKWGA